MAVLQKWVPRDSNCIGIGVSLDQLSLCCSPYFLLFCDRFHPPNPPGYGISGTGTDNDPYRIQLQPDIQEYMGSHTAIIDCIRTKSKSRIVVALFAYPGATYTMIVSHGNATDLGYMFPVLVQMSISLRINVVGYDYSGYGVCSGTPTDRQTYQDIDAVFNWCKENIIGDTKIILYGQSVGSGPSCYVASGKRRQEVAGLVLHSPILSGVRVLSEARGILACFDIFPNIDRIQHVRCPVFVMHGKDDVEVRLNHGTGLHNAVPKEYQTTPWWVVGRGHNDLTLGYEREYFERLLCFLAVVSNRSKGEVLIENQAEQNRNSLNAYMKANPIDDDSTAVEVSCGAGVN